MKKLFKPYCLLLYLQVIISFFFIGLLIAAWTNAASGQGLAGGAIVFFYGLISAGIALIVSFFIAYNFSREIIIRLNKILALIILLLIAYFIWNYYTNVLPRREAKTQNNSSLNAPKINDKLTKADAIDISSNSELSSSNKLIQNQIDHTGLGMFTPNFYENKTLYFYGDITNGKSVMEHEPTDSITFKQGEYGGYEIATAPPWLVPDHLKLDYDMLYFKVQSISHDFLEVTVNTQTNLTAFVDKQSGRLQFWPEFLMGVNSVEFLNPVTQKLHERPFAKFGSRLIGDHLMRPVIIRNQWMYIEVLDDDFKIIDSGWIRWMKDGKLQIKYSLLS